MSAYAGLGLPPPENHGTEHATPHETPYTRSAKTLLQAFLTLFTEAGFIHFLPPPPPDLPDDAPI